MFTLSKRCLLEIQNGFGICLRWINYTRYRLIQKIYQMNRPLEEILQQKRFYVTCYIFTLHTKFKDLWGACVSFCPFESAVHSKTLICTQFVHICNGLLLVVINIFILMIADSYNIYHHTYQCQLCILLLLFCIIFFSLGKFI